MTVSHIVVEHWVDVFGLFVGVIGICIAIYLTMVSPYEHSRSSRYTFFLVGASIMLLSNEPLLESHAFIVGSRIFALLVLASIQFTLMVHIVYYGPFPPPARAIRYQLAQEGLIDPDEDLSNREIRELAKEHWPPGPVERDKKPLREWLRFWR